MLAKGDATGVFQFESSGMREALKQVKPTVFEDLIALVALYRPGPMQYIPVYARRKNGQEQVTYIDPRLKAITGVTYGTCIYQEQYLEIAKQIAGFSPGEADDLRKAIGKKIHSLMASLKEKFLEGCAKTGTTPSVANQLWKDMEASQDYSFNKSHAACYALVAYGALDSTGASRMGMLNALEAALGSGAARQQEALFGQESMFQVEHPAITAEEFEKPELLRLEKETLGLYVSEHPLHAIRDQLRRKTDCALADVERRRDGEVVTVGGIVSALKHLTTKKGEPMVFMRLDDVTGGAEVVVFNSVYAHSRELCVMDRILIVKGRIDHKQEGETKLLAMEVAPFEAVAERKEVTIRIDARVARAGVVRDLALLVKDFPGDSRVNLLLEMTEGTKQFVLGPEYKVKPVPDFFAEAKALLGEAAVL